MATMVSETQILLENGHWFCRKKTNEASAVEKMWFAADSREIKNYSWLHYILWALPEQVRTEHQTENCSSSNVTLWYYIGKGGGLANSKA